MTAAGSTTLASCSFGDPHPSRGRLVTCDEYNNLQAGDGVTYRPHPDAPAEEKVTCLIRGISQSRPRPLAQRPWQPKQQPSTTR